MLGPNICVSGNFLPFSVSAYRYCVLLRKGGFAECGGFLCICLGQCGGKEQNSADLSGWVRGGPNLAVRKALPGIRKIKSQNYC